MTEHADNQRHACMQQCEAVFIQFSAQKPVGGVEAMRICRENCARDDALQP